MDRGPRNTLGRKQHNEGRPAAWTSRRVLNLEGCAGSSAIRMWSRLKGRPPGGKQKNVKIGGNGETCGATTGPARRAAPEALALPAGPVSSPRHHEAVG